MLYVPEISTKHNIIKHSTRYSYYMSDIMHQHKTVYIPAEHRVRVWDPTHIVGSKHCLYPCNNKNPTVNVQVTLRLNTKQGIPPKPSMPPLVCPRLNSKYTVVNILRLGKKKPVYTPHLELYSVSMYIQNLVQNLKINYKINTNKNIQTAKTTVWEILPKQHLGTRIINTIQTTKYKLNKIKST